jgi:hypothetical protein
MSEHSAELQGRVVHFRHGDLTRAAGLTGRHEVWIARSTADVASAIAHARNRTIIVRSGMQGAATTDVVHAPGAVVVNLAHLNTIGTTAGEVRANAGATSADIEHTWQRGISRSRFRITLSKHRLQPRERRAIRIDAETRSARGVRVIVLRL